MPLTYSVYDSVHEGYRVLELRDDQRKQRARIVPAVGATCIHYTVTHHGQTEHLLDPPPDLKTIAQHPIAYGTPILFPFPNRIRHGQFLWRGERFEFEDKSSGGHHIHGLVFNRPWKVEDLSATPERAVCTLSLDSREHEDIELQYPFSFLLRVEYLLQESALTMTLTVTNVGDETFPMGVGFHPYFRCPISPRTEPSRCFVIVPASAYWELDSHLLPTGRILPVSGKLDLRAGVPCTDVQLDHVFTQLIRDERKRLSRCIVEDRFLRLRTVVESDEVFREIVVYTPPNRRAICFEPYTCPTDAPNLAARGLDAGLIELEPNQIWHGSMRIFPQSM